MSLEPNGPFSIGDQVIHRGLYKGVVSGHRGPQVMVQLDKPIGGHRVIASDQHDLRRDPNAKPKPVTERPPLRRPTRPPLPRKTP